MEGSPKGNSQSSAIVKRTSKQEGTIRLRFRLRDGRGVDLYHKSDIDADLKDLDKFTDTGELKPRMSIYNKQLKLDIDTEIEASEQYGIKGYDSILKRKNEFVVEDVSAKKKRSERTNETFAYSRCIAYKS